MNKIAISWTKSDRYLIIPFLTGALSAFFILTIFAFYYQSLPPKLPVFYSLPWGQSQLVTKQQFLILPTVLTLISLVNTFIAHSLHPLQLVLKRTLSVSIVLISLILLTSALKILFIFV